MKRFFVFAVMFLNLNLLSESKAVKFGRAIELYLRGEYEKVIPVVKDILKTEPDNKKAKDLYLKSLKNLAKGYERDKKYKDALSYVEEGLKIAPDDKELKNSSVRLKGLLKEKKEEKKLVRRKIEKKRAVKKLKTEKRKTEKKKEVRKIEKEKKGKKKIEKKPEKEKRVKKEVKIEKKEAGRLSPFIYVVLFLNFFGVVFLSYLFITQSPKKEEEKLLLQERRISQLVDSLSREEQYEVILRQQKKIMDMLEKIPRAENTIKEQSQKLIKLIENFTRGQKTIKIELPKGSGREVITDINPFERVRADSVELIGEMFDDPVIIEEMLQPYLSDENNRVLANACKVLFKYNRRRSLSILKDMLNSSDKWMRMSSAWAFGEIGDEESVKYLRILLNDNERQVRIRAVKSFRELKKKRIPIPREIELKIQEIEKEENISE